MITEKEICEQFPITDKVIMEENKNYTEVTQANFHRRQGALWLLGKLSSQIETEVIKKNAEADCNNCYECLKDKKDERTGLSIAFSRMIVCPECGNKRCPKATDHNLDCTNSNESGQPGSRY